MKAAEAAQHKRHEARIGRAWPYLMCLDVALVSSRDQSAAVHLAVFEKIQGTGTHPLGSAIGHGTYGGECNQIHRTGT